MKEKIKDETSINGAQLDALRRFFNDLEGKMAYGKLVSDNKLAQNNEHDAKAKEEREKLQLKRKQTDAINRKLSQAKKQRDREWRNSIHLEHGIEGRNGYPSIELPNKEVQLRQKLEK